MRVPVGSGTLGAPRKLPPFGLLLLLLLLPSALVSSACRASTTATPAPTSLPPSP